MTMIYEKITTEDWDYQRKTPMCPDKGAFEISYGHRTFFMVDRKLHRTDGPAEIYPGQLQAYYQNGILHRIDGPAEIWFDDIDRYWLFGRRYSKEEWEPLATQLSLKEQVV